MDSAEIAAVIALTIAAFGGFQGLFRWLASPRLELRVHSGAPKPLSLPEYAVHHIEVWNIEWPWYLRPLFLASAPEGCQIKFQYWKEDNGVLSSSPCSEWLHGRWNDNPEPLTQSSGRVSVNPAALMTNRRIAKLFPSEKRGHDDAYPFTVAFAIKKEGEPDFYHFNDDSYVHGSAGKPWCNQAWQLGPGTYIVTVRVTGYGLLAAKAAKFRLHNLGPSHTDFKLIDIEKANNYLTRTSGRRAKSRDDGR